MKELATYFQNKKVSSVLDVGCGGGDFIKILTEVFPSETKLTGIDAFEAPLAEARQKYKSENIDFLLMEGEKIAFPDNSFDVVTISFALHHLADVSKTFAEMKRVVKPDGWLIVNEIVSEVQNEEQETQKKLHHLKSFTDRLDGITHRETYTKAEVLEIVEANGIKTEHSFLNLKMEKPTTDPEFLSQRMNQLNSLIEPLKKHGFYEEKKSLIAEIEERINKKGFQIAPSIVVVGRKV